MFSTDLKVFRFAPDADGKGGTKTGLSRFTSTPINDTLAAENVFVWLGSWKQESDKTLLPPGLTGGNVGNYFSAQAPFTDYLYPVSLHSFSRYSLTDVTAPPTIEIIGCNAKQLTTNPVTLGYQVWNYSTLLGGSPTVGTTRIIRTSGSNAQTARFLTINNRCLIADGQSGAQWYTGSDIRTILQNSRSSGGGSPTNQINVSGGGLITGQTLTVVGMGATMNGTWTIDVVDANSNSMWINLRHSVFTGAVAPGATSKAWPLPNYILGVEQPKQAVSLTFSAQAKAEYYSNKASDYIASPALDSPISKFVAGNTATLYLPTTPVTTAAVTLAEDAAAPGTTQAIVGASATGPFPMSDWSGRYAILPDTRTDISSYVTYAKAGDPTIYVYGTIGSNAIPGTSGPITNSTNAYALVGAKFEATISSTVASGFTTGVIKGTILDCTEDYTALPAPSTGETKILLDTPSPVDVNGGGVSHNFRPYDPFSLTGVRARLTAFPFGAVARPPHTGDWPQEYLTSATGLAWTGNQPMYAYAWYDPVTGHMSNISPVTTVPTTILSPRNISIPLGQWALEYPDPITAMRFTHIVFFRNLLSGGSSLFVVGGLDPSDASTWRGISSNWRDTYSSSSIINVQSNAGVAELLLDSNTPNTLMDGDQVTVWGITTGGNAASINRTWYVKFIDATHVTLYWDAALLIPYGYIGPDAAAVPGPQIGTLQWAYWHDNNPDSALLVNGVFRAPIFTNNRPRVIQNGITTTLSPKEMTYWDGRLWVVGTQEPDAVHFSCDTVQCPLGRPEESFPDTNVLRIPADDGQVRGLRLFGESMLITTERWAYTVVGNNETNYRLMRVSTRMQGVGTYQMDEIAADVEQGGATMVYFGNDNRLYAMPMGGEPMWISRDIQDQIDLAVSLPSFGLSNRQAHDFSRLHVFNIGGRRGFFFFYPCAIGTIFSYDFDNKVWTTKHLRGASGQVVQPLAYTTAYGQDPSPVEVIGYLDTSNATLQGAARSWLDPTIKADTSVDTFVTTFPSGFDGQKIRKQIQFVRIYTNIAYNAASPWSCRITPDYGTPFTATFVPNPDSTFPWVKGAANGVYEMIAPAASFNNIAFPIGDGAPVVGYNFSVSILYPTLIPLGNPVSQLYAIDVGYQPIGQEIDQ